MDSLQSSVTTKELIIDGQRFTYKLITKESIQRKPLFFVSGAFQNMRSWKSFARVALDRGIPVILADLPGTGDSDPLPIEYGLDFLSESINLILDDACIDRVSIISVSYGTPIGYHFAQKFPHRVQELVLAGTMKEIPAHMRQRTVDTLIPLKAGNLSKFAKDVIEGLMCMDPDKFITRRDLAYRLLYSQLTNMNSSDKKKYILNTTRLLTQKPLDLKLPPRCRTLVFTGEHDCFTRPDYCREIADSLDSSIFTTIANTDHLFHIENPSITIELCHRFAQNLPLDTVEGINQLEYRGCAYSALQRYPCTA